MFGVPGRGATVGITSWAILSLRTSEDPKCATGWTVIHSPRLLATLGDATNKPRVPRDPEDALQWVGQP